MKACNAASPHRAIRINQGAATLRRGIASPWRLAVGSPRPQPKDPARVAKLLGLVCPVRERQSWRRPKVADDRQGRGISYATLAAIDRARPVFLRQASPSTYPHSRLRAKANRQNGRVSKSTRTVRSLRPADLKKPCVRHRMQDRTSPEHVGLRQELPMSRQRAIGHLS